MPELTLHAADEDAMYALGARLAAVGEELGPALAGVELFNEPIDPVATDPRAADTFSKESDILYRTLNIKKVCNNNNSVM